MHGLTVEETQVLLSTHATQGHGEAGSVGAVDRYEQAMEVAHFHIGEGMRLGAVCSALKEKGAHDLAKALSEARRPRNKTVWTAIDVLGPDTTIEVPMASRAEADVMSVLSQAHGGAILLHERDTLEASTLFAQATAVLGREEKQEEAEDGDGKLYTVTVKCYDKTALGRRRGRTGTWRGLA